MPTDDASRAELLAEIERLAGRVRDLEAELEQVRPLAEEAQRYRTLIQAQGEGAAIVDDEERFVFVNRAAEEIFGVEEGKLVGRNLRDFLSPEQFALVTSQTARRRTGDRSSYDLKIQREDGVQPYLLVTGTPWYDELGRYAGTLGVFRDMTERREQERQNSRLEERLREVEKMDSIGRLAGGIAHDLNNLLAPIVGYASMVIRELGREHALRESVKEILAAGERAQDMTSRLLAFGRRQTLKTQVLDLNDVVVHFRKTLERLIREDIELVFELSSELGSIRGDPSHLLQVLVNLVINARDALPPGGRIVVETFETANVEPVADSDQAIRPEAYVLLVVTDDGEGMDSETSSRIFEPFFTTKRAGKGTGLGLSTVYGIVKQHGGFITVDSHPGQGTTFKIHFPRVEERAERLAKSSEEVSIVRGRETILVAEDDDQVRQLACTMLRAIGYEVYATPSGEDAIKLYDLLGRPIDLLLTDVVMPGMNGRELYEKLAAEHPDLKVLYMSGYSFDVIADCGIGDSRAEVLPKPFTEKLLTRAVRSALDRKME